MRKISVFAVLMILLLTSLPLVSSGQPPIDTTTLYLGGITIGKLTADPKLCYDATSNNILMNVYDTLIFTNPESHTTFYNKLASAYGKDDTGVYGGTPEEPVWWFTVNTTGKVFQTWKDRYGVAHVGDAMTMEDVEYSFKLGLVEDLLGSPIWMFYNPLFDSMNMEPFYGTTTDLKNFADDMASTIWVSGNTIFFRMAFPFPDTAWQQIISQTWSGIMNKEWAIDRGCWDGDFIKTVTGGAVGTGTGAQTMFQILYDMPLGGTDKAVPIIDGTETIYLDGTPTTDYTMSSKNGTIYFNTPPANGAAITADYDYDHFFLWRRFPGGASSYSPIDTKLPDYPQASYDFMRMCGTGPYILTTWDSTAKYCQLDKFDNYWGGWAGKHLDRIMFNWIDGSTAAWPTRLAKFLSGDYDYIVVPRARKNVLLKLSWPVEIPLDGVYGIKNIFPVLALDSMFFTFNFDQETPYDGTGAIGAGLGIPSDFFHDVHVRRAFAYMFNYTTFIKNNYYNEAEQPATWSIKGLDPDYTDPTVLKYPTNLILAKIELQAAMFTRGTETKSAWDWGFYLTILYNEENEVRQKMCTTVNDSLNALSIMFGVLGQFNCSISAVNWNTYQQYMKNRWMPIFFSGWWADYSDPDDFARSFMHTNGALSYYQAYSNATVDQLLDWGIHNATTLPNGDPNPAREYCYKELQRIYHEDCPSVPIIQPIGRYFCRTWFKGWYYNALYRGCHSQDLESHGMYFYHYWKQNGAIDTTADQANTVCDVNWDNKVDMKDIGTAIKAFGSVPGGAKWYFMTDVALNMGDRKIDMKDIGWVVQKFGWAA